MCVVFKQHAIFAAHRIYRSLLREKNKSNDVLSFGLFCLKNDIFLRN
jgi:hypothetical protein